MLIRCPICDTPDYLILNWVDNCDQKICSNCAKTLNIPYDINMHPEILSSTNIPKPLHGLNPRSLMGKQQWDDARVKVYSGNDNKCAACGVHSSRARYKKGLEAHEIYNIDWQTGSVKLNLIVPLCHMCHMFIHSGFLASQLNKKIVSELKASSILRHGIKLLRQCKSPIYYPTAVLAESLMINVKLETFDVNTDVEWSDWQLDFNNTIYKSCFKDYDDWHRHYNR